MRILLCILSGLFALSLSAQPIKPTILTTNVSNPNQFGNNGGTASFKNGAPTTNLNSWGRITVKNDDTGSGISFGGAFVMTNAYNTDTALHLIDTGNSAEATFINGTWTGSFNGAFTGGTLSGSTLSLTGNATLAGASNYVAGVMRQAGTLISTQATTQIGTLNFPADLGGPLIDVSVTSATAGATKIGYTNRIDGNDVVRHYANSDGSGAVTNAIVEIPYGVQFSPLGNTNYTVYAAGTAYTLTATPALLDFGTTDPSLTLAQAGTYLLFANAGVKYTGATYAGAQTIALKLRRTNNTAADVANGSRSVELPVLTAFTGGDSMSLPPVIYTATAGDIIQIFGSVSATPSAGSVVTDSAEIVALRIQ